MPDIEMQGQEIQKLVQLVAGLPQFKNSLQGRERLLDEAGLSAILVEVKLDGSLADVAWDIIRRLRQYGTMPNDVHAHALGAFLRRLLDIPDLPQDEARTIVILMLKYKLIDSAEYFKPLRDRYGIKDADLQLDKPSLDSLNDSQRQQLHLALISAFPPYGALSQMLNERLHENLGELIEPGTLDDVVQDLIAWAETAGRTEELIRKARAHNPTDLLLKAFSEQMLVTPHTIKS